MSETPLHSPPPPPDPDDAKTPSEIEQALLAELEMLEGVSNERRKDRGMDYYIPNPMQLKAHKCVSRTILYCGGNRAGKSTFGCLELCFHLTRKYPDWFPKERRFKKPIKAVISATEFPVITRVIEPKIMEFLPRGSYKVKRTAQGYLQRLEMKDGGTVDFLTLEMKDEAYESADWDFAWCDEPQALRKYEAIMRGLTDRRGLMVITFTPLTEPWMKEKLVDRADGKLISCFTVNIRDNKFDINGNPILNEQAIAELESVFSEDVRDTRISGHFFHLRGVIYKEFSDAHVQDFSYDDPKFQGVKYPVICVIDPHDRRPHHVIWAYIDPCDDIFIDYEYEGHIELDDLAKKLMEIEQARGYNMRKRIIDPNFGRKPARVGSNLSVIQELRRHGLACYEGVDNLELGHLVVRDFLHWDNRKPQTALNKPKVFFSRDRAARTIRSMRNIQYEDWEGKAKSERDLKETEKDKDTDGADCVRYLLVQKPTYGNMYLERHDDLIEQPY